MAIEVDIKSILCIYLPFIIGHWLYYSSIELFVFYGLKCWLQNIMHGGYIEDINDGPFGFSEVVLRSHDLS